MKVLFVQFSIPRIDTLEYKSNPHLASGYLVSHVAESFPQHEFMILPRIYTDLAGDEVVLARIIDINPDLIAFTLYLWNIERSMYIATKIKQLLPKVEMIFGGPEVNPDNGFLFSHDIFSQGISGEGESAFYHFLSGKSISSIPGAVYRQADHILANKDHEILNDINCTHNPYLQKRIETTPDICMFFETVRGCPFKCNFCYYNKLYQKIIPTEHHCVKKLVQHALDNDFQEVFLLDPSFNVQPGFSELLKILIEINHEQRLKFITELRVDLLTQEHINQLIKMNLKEVELGLQTINPNALALMNRTQNIDKFVRNTKELNNAGVSCKVDLIIGLPGDTPDGFKKSVDFVKKENLAANIQVFLLSVLSGTEFSLKAHKYGIIRNSHPPYYVTSTNHFTPDDIYYAFGYAEEAFDISFDPIPESILSTKTETADQSHTVQFSGNFYPYNKIIMNNDLNISKIDFEQLADSITLHFLKADQKIKGVSSFIHEITKSLTLTCFEIILECDKILRKNQIDLLLSSMVIYREHFVNMDIEPLLGKDAIISMRLTLILPYSRQNLTKLETIQDGITVYFKIDNYIPGLIRQLVEDEFDLFITGSSQEAVFSFLLENNLLRQGIVFDDFSLELQKRNFINPGLRLNKLNILRI